MTSFESILNTFTLQPIDAWIIPCSAIGFYVLYKILAAKVFGPYLAFLEQREASSSGAEVSAREMLEKAETISQDYEKKLQSNRVDLMKEKLRVLSEARTMAEKIILEAEGAAHKEISKAREEIKKSEQANREVLDRAATQLAAEIAERVEKPNASMVS